MYTRSRNHERDNLGAEADDPKECAEGNKTDRPSLAERAAVGYVVDRIRAIHRMIKFKDNKSLDFF